MHFFGLSEWLQNRSAILRGLLGDVGNICLGAAAIFLTRAFPSSVPDDFSVGMLLASTAFAFLGLVLRFLSKSESP